MGYAELTAISLGAGALVRTAQGRGEAAVRLFTELADKPDACATVYGASQLPSWVRALVILDEVAVAERLASAAPPSHPLGEHVHVAVTAAVAEAVGEHTTALAGYIEAAQRMHDFTMYVEEAFALLGQGRCLLTLALPEEATPVLQQARDMFADMGARPALSETESLLASLI
jgi:hypothetical protein